MIEEKEKRIKMFNEIDVDKSGFIEYNEFEEYFFKYFNLNDENSQVEKRRIFKLIFSLCDKKPFLKEKDNRIDKKEFKRIYEALQKIKGERCKKSIGQFLYHVIDKNENGVITKNEMRKVTELLKLTEEVLDVFFDELDLNKDGNIDWEEFSNWYDE